MRTHKRIFIFVMLFLLLLVFSGCDKQQLPVSYTITVANGIRNGAVTPSSVQAVAGTTVTLIITPDNGYQLNTISIYKSDSSQISIKGTGNIRTFIMPEQNIIVDAVFELIPTPYLISISNNIHNGTVTTNVSEAMSGETVILQINPDTGYQLVSLSITAADNSIINVRENNNSKTFIMPSQNVTVSAIFSAISFPITIIGTENGYVTTSTSSACTGATISLEVYPENGYQLNSLTIASGSTTVNVSGTGNTRTFSMPANGVTITPIFSAINYSITVANGITNGLISVNKTVATVGETITLTIIPNTNYKLKSLAINGSNIIVTINGNDNCQTFSMPAQNVNITAVFTVDPCSLYTVLPDGTDGTGGTGAHYLLFGNWPQTNSSGNIAEPIKWRILTTNYDHDGDPSTPGQKLLLAENILIGCKFYDYQMVQREIDNEWINGNNYEHSRIRAFLNGLSYQKKSTNTATQTEDVSFVNNGFLQIAFTTIEQEAISTTTVINNSTSTNPDGEDNTTNRYSSDNPTYDKIFLISKQEATKSEYGFSNVYASDSTRIRKTTAYSYSHDGVTQHSEEYGPVGNGNWYLRSPGATDTDYVEGVDPSGKVCVWLPANQIYGIVPALCIE